MLEKHEQKQRHEQTCKSDPECDQGAELRKTGALTQVQREEADSRRDNDIEDSSSNVSHGYKYRLAVRCVIAAGLLVTPE